MTAARRAILALVIFFAIRAFAAEGQVTETVLGNGLKVLIKEVHSAPVFTSQVWYRVGSRNEHTGITGASHILEHMMFKGTKRHGKGEFSRLIKSKGGLENASTWIDFTDYWELLSSEHLELALELEADRMANSLFDPKEFEAERIVVRSELEGRENSPDILLYKDIHAVAYKAHPYRWPTIGWTPDVENVTRDQVYKYYRTYYHPNNATLVIVGDVDTGKTLDLVRRHFGKIPRGPEPPNVRTKEPPQRGERRFVLRQQGTAERAIMAYHIPEITHPDTYPLMVLDQILSGGRSSRLYQALVEGQLATSAWSSASSRKDPGLFLLGATGREGTAAPDLEKALLAEVEKARAAPPSQDELTRAKNQLEAYLVFQNDSVSDQGEQLGYYETVATWRYLETLLPRVMAVTGEDVQRVAKEYLTEENRTVGWFVPTEPPAGGVERPAGPGELHFREPLALAVNYLSHPELSYPSHPEMSYPSHPEPVEGWRLRSGSSFDRLRMAVNVAELTTKSAPAAAPRKTVEPKRVVLVNGMVVIVHENHSNRTVAIAGNLKAGGYFDPPGKRGLASFTADMLSRGTGRRSALDIASEIEFVGAELGMSADTETVRFSGKGLSKDLGMLLDVLSDEMRNPTFPEDQIEKLKGEVVSGIEQENESPRARANREFYRTVFPEGHPYRPQTIEEDKAAVASFTRDDLVAFHKRNYGPETAIIVIAGDVKADDAVAAVEKYFGDWTPIGPPRKLDIPRTPLASGPSRQVIPIADKTQVRVVFGHAGQLARTDPDFYAANVMNHVLGGGAGLESRLGKRLREDMGLVYFVSTSFDASLGDGPWMASFGANPANIDKAIAAADEEVRKYIGEGPTKKEFDEAIDYIVGILPVRLETNAGVANVLVAAEFYGLGMDYIQRYPSIYRSVTLDQIRQAASKYLHPDRRSLVIAGPYGG